MYLYAITILINSLTYPSSNVLFLMYLNCLLEIVISTYKDECVDCSLLFSFAFLLSAFTLGKVHKNAFLFDHMKMNRKDNFALRQVLGTRYFCKVRDSCIYLLRMLTKKYNLLTELNKGGEKVES